jgi:hypothetical protein
MGNWLALQRPGWLKFYPEKSDKNPLPPQENQIEDVT